MPEADDTTVADDLADELTLLGEAAREAGAIAMGYFRKDPEVWMKGGKSPVSEADLAVDRFLKDALLTARPDYGWLSEETAADPLRLEAERLFVVDPIDGTRGFLEGQSTWCVSIAIVSRGRPVAGVLDCPARGEVFAALKARGARRNGKAIAVAAPGDRPRVGGPKAMIEALPRKQRERISRQPYVPSLAYRVAMVANGDIDATFVKPNAHDWDLAAADLVLQEAGGAIATVSGRSPRYGLPGARLGAMVAGSGDLLERLRQSMRK
ncbi:MAG: 3'(2'),5'-bisphosphate nucleotidase CysQ [Rhizobiaceae bacterium]